MMIYQNLEPNSSIKKIRYFMIFLVSLILISVISSIIYIYVSNDKNNFNTRRKLDEIEDDITTLFNYTETMSDFIVDNYKPPEIKSNGISNDILFNNLFKIHLDLKKEFDDFRNKSHQVQLDLKRTGEINKNRTEAFLRKMALDFLNKNGIYPFLTFSESFPHCLFDNYYNFDISSFDKNYYFEELLKIDYDNFIVSFAYFSDDPVENFKAHPIFKRINSSLVRDYDFIFPLHEPRSDYWWLRNQYYINYNYQSSSGTGIIYIDRGIPFHTYKCIPSYELIYMYSGSFEGYNYLSKVYDEYEYIRKLVSFISFPPTKFI